MNWQTMQQLVRILLYSGGSVAFGEGVADGDVYQQAISGAVAIAAFVWWAVKERQAIKGGDRV